MITTGHIHMITRECCLIMPKTTITIFDGNVCVYTNLYTLSYLIITTH